MILTLHSTKLSLRRREPPIAPDTIAKLGGEADDVAAVVERALEVDKPKARYAVTASAHILLAVRSLVSDRMWDWLMRQRFPHPTRAKTGAQT